jgi:hypothetical protein
MSDARLDIDITPLDDERHGILAEYARCGYLRRSDIDRLIGAGVPPMALHYDGDGAGLTVARDRVVFLDGGRFEFARYLRDAASATSALVIPCRDEAGEIDDLVAWRGEQVATWLGRVSMIGQHCIYQPRLSEPLVAHETPLDWLRTGRHGVVVIAPQGAAPLLNLSAPIGVESPIYGHRLRSALTIPSPRIVVAEKPISRAA